MRVSSRLLLLFIVIAIVFGAFFYLFYHIKMEEMRVYSESDMHQRRANIEAVLQMKTSAQMMLTEEYSLSDDIWDFTFNPDPVWGKRNLKKIVSVFGYSFIQVYDSESEKVFSLAQEEHQALSSFRLSPQIINSLRSGKKEGFYTVYNQSVIYCTVSSIHLVDDPLKLEPSAGFFLIAQVYNHSYLHDLANLIKYDIQISKNDPGQNKSISERYDALIVKELKNYENESIAWLSFYSSNPFLSRLRSLGNLILFGTMGFIFIFLLMQYFLIEQWISTPLGLISQSLDKMDPTIIQKLSTADNEFSEVASLIERFFEQQEILICEIEERTLTESRLREMEEQTRKILSTSPESIIVTNLEGLILSVNDITLKLLEFPSEVGILEAELGLMDLVDPQDRGTLKEILNEVCREGHVKNQELSFHNSRHEKFSALLSASVILDDDGAPSKIVFITRDLTEMKDLELQLRQSQKLESIGTLAGGIAHDFNNIITIIAGYIALSAGRISESNRAQHDLDEALKACLRAKSLIGKILTFSRQGEPDVGDIILADIINDTLPMIRAIISSKIAIELEINSYSYARVDNTEMQQVIINLATNAYHAMRPKAGTLKISLDERAGFELIGIDPKVRLESNYLHLKVEDSGCGIAPEHLTRIFDPYFSTKDTGEGSGLGLSIVHGIISGYHGFITVNSVVGEGSTFNIYLPCTTEPRVIPKTVILTEYPFIPVKIMMVDDEPALTEIFLEALTSAGYQVESFTESPAALAAFAANPDQYELLIADINMPQMDGINLASEILQIRKIPVVLYSGFLDKLLQERAEAIGISQILNKPILPDEMVDAVRRVVYESLET